MSNLTQRVITAAVAIPVILAICMFGGIMFAGFITIISAIALTEFYAMCRAKGAHPQVGLGIVAGSCVTLSFYHRELRYYISGLFEGTRIKASKPARPVRSPELCHFNGTNAGPSPSHDSRADILTPPWRASSESSVTRIVRTQDARASTA